MITLTDYIKALRIIIEVIRRGHHSHARRNGYFLIVRRIIERLIQHNADDAGDLLALHTLLHDSDTEIHKEVKQRLYLLDELMEFLQKKYQEDKKKTDAIPF
jgi:hypothetical protein